MYGNTGIINLEERNKSQHILTQDKIELWSDGQSEQSTS